MAKHEQAEAADVSLCEVEERYTHFARRISRPPRTSWCDTCQAYQIMEVLEDGTIECVICRLRQERQLPLLQAPDDA